MGPTVRKLRQAKKDTSKEIAETCDVKITTIPGTDVRLYSRPNKKGVPTSQVIRAIRAYSGK